jgi:hypothetical protein
MSVKQKVTTPEGNSSNWPPRSRLGLVGRLLAIGVHVVEQVPPKP